MTIQNLLIAATQNMRKLISNIPKRFKNTAEMARICAFCSFLAVFFTLTQKQDRLSRKKDKSIELSTMIS